MEWTEPKSPTEGISHYNHTICETPIGKCIIEWKSWKDDPEYSITIDDNYIDSCYTLENAKLKAKGYLMKKLNELHYFLNQ